MKRDLKHPSTSLRVTVRLSEVPVCRKGREVWIYEQNDFEKSIFISDFQIKFTQLQRIFTVFTNKFHDIIIGQAGNVAGN